eukprot:m.94798 g.94798  ORF g.94798 m.94798 type:complete len:479 (-) comp8724_c0_seq3:65-1501(-)
MALRRVARGRWTSSYALFLLVTIFMLNQADRQVLSVLIPSGLRCGEGTENDKAHDGTDDCISFSDSQMGILTGPAFNAVYTLAGLPLSYLSDRYSRIIILLCGLFAWSAVTLATTFAQNYGQLVGLRMLLGVGEASCNPAAYSLLSDYFLPSQRATTLAIFHFGAYLGGGFGYMSGAINDATGWRNTFLYLAIPGFALALVAALTLREPPRGVSDDVKRAGSFTLREFFEYLTQSPSFLCLCLAASVRHIAGYSLGAWLPTFYEREFDLDSKDFGVAVGIVVVTGGGLGSFLGGLASDRLAQKTPAAKALVIFASNLVAAPFAAGVFLATTPTTSYLVLFFAYLTAETWLGVAAAIVQDVMQPQMRAKASAVYIAISTLIGGCGPLFVGELLGSDGIATRRYGEKHGVKYVLMYLVPVCYVLSSLLFGVVGLLLIRRRRLQSALLETPDGCAEEAPLLNAQTPHPKTLPAALAESSSV